MHVVLDASMAVTAGSQNFPRLSNGGSTYTLAVQITKPSTRQPSLPSDRTITPEPIATTQPHSDPPRGSSEASIPDA